MKLLLALMLVGMVVGIAMGAEDLVTFNHNVINPSSPYNTTVDGIYNKFWCAANGCVPVNEDAKKSLSILEAAEGLDEVLQIYEEAAKRAIATNPELRESYQDDLVAIRRFRDAVKGAGE